MGKMEDTAWSSKGVSDGRTSPGESASRTWRKTNPETGQTDKEVRSQAMRTSGVQKMVWKCLVFPGVLLALTFDLPTIAFRSEDLPTFGWLHQEIHLVSSLFARFVRELTHPMRPTVR